MGGEVGLDDGCGFAGVAGWVGRGRADEGLEEGDVGWLVGLEGV